MNEKRKKDLIEAYSQLTDEMLARRLAEGETAYESEAYLLMRQEASRRKISLVENEEALLSKSKRLDYRHSDIGESAPNKFFSVSGFNGFFRGIVLNIVIFIGTSLLSHINPELAMICLLGISAGVGFMLIQSKKFPAYYIIACIVFPGIANLVMFTMATQRVTEKGKVKSL